MKILDRTPALAFVGAILGFTTLFGATTAFAGEPEHSYSTMYIFGDSLSDSGNAFALNGQTAHPPFEEIPSAAYGVGGHHFSNGKTWVEVLAAELELVESAKPAFRDPLFGNFAVGGARATGGTAPSFTVQVGYFLAVTGGYRDPDALYVVQFGGNDIRDAINHAATAIYFGTDPFVAIHNATVDVLMPAAAATANNIEILVGAGAQHLLVANAPNLAVAPAVPLGAKPIAYALSDTFNALLAQQLAAKGIAHETLDLFTIVSQMSAAPGAYGLTDGTTTCLAFGVTAGAFCKDRDEYLFWDGIHPTKTAHRLLGEIAYNNVIN